MAPGVELGDRVGRADRLGDDLDQAPEVLLGDRERRHQHDHVSERSDDDAAAAGLEHHAVTEPQLRVVLAEVDADHQAALPDLLDLAHALHLRRASSASSRIFGWIRTSVRSRLNRSREAIAAAQASGLPV